jgi:hypothetical protein
VVSTDKADLARHSFACAHKSGVKAEMGDEEVYECLRCGRKLSKEAYETYDGLCEECYEVEIDELDYEEDP